MVRVISNLFKNVIMWSVQQTISVIRFALPYALRLVIFTLGISVRLSILALIASFKGMRPVAQKVAEDWTRRAIERGFPTLWEVYLYWMFYYLAIETILAGWAVILFTIVFTADVGYRWLF
jgi:hypothetical protein